MRNNQITAREIIEMKRGEMPRKCTATDNGFIYEWEIDGYKIVSEHIINEDGSLKEYISWEYIGEV